MRHSVGYQPFTATIFCSFYAFMFESLASWIVYYNTANDLVSEKSMSTYQELHCCDEKLLNIHLKHLESTQYERFNQNAHLSNTADI